jgi:hypothetical protein
MFRQCPSGTSVYSTRIISAAKAVTWSDGSAQPPQPVSMTTPNGRGRRPTAPTKLAMPSVRFATMMAMIRCRKRRSASSEIASPISSPLRTHQELIAASARHSPGASSPASHLTTASSATVTVTAGPRSPPANTAIVSVTSTTAASSQPTPLVWR